MQTSMQAVVNNIMPIDASLRLQPQIFAGKIEGIVEEGIDKR